MVRLNEEIALHILSQCTGRTKSALRDRFGISYNTFRKIEHGEPIRSSLAERLENKIKTELGS